MAKKSDGGGRQGKPTKGGGGNTGRGHTLSAEILAQIREGLKKNGKTQSGLARLLGVDRSQMTMLIQGKRRVQVDELTTISNYLEIDIGIRRVEGEASGKGLLRMGGISAGLWQERGAPMPTNIQPLLHEKFPASKQVTFEILQSSADGRLKAGEFIIAAPWADHRTEPKIGDIFVYETVRDSLILYTLWSVEHVGGNRVEPRPLVASASAPVPPMSGKPPKDSRFAYLVLAKHTPMIPLDH